MAARIRCFDHFDDKVLATRSQGQAAFTVHLCMNPEFAVDSELAPGWKCYRIEINSPDARIPPRGALEALLQFSNEDAGADYNFASPTAYDSVKFGEKFKMTNRENPTAPITHKPTLAAVDALPAEVVWKFGNAEPIHDPVTKTSVPATRQVVEFRMVREAPCELHRNFESCLLAPYRPAQVAWHVDAGTHQRIVDAVAKHGLFQLPTA